MKIKMVHADNVDELFSRVREVDKAQDIDDELIDTSRDFIKVSDSKMIYCEVLVYRTGDDDEEL
ncbi:hypothetical protein ALX04_006710 [Lactiplantibacillus plantarum subsp. plantarum]|uniref:Uncharacterized protein n=1 Tax=Lactiplantibacillus plantarum TaxID=1590 RepID=A0A1E3KMX6_LACPN|nr:hypothetical protein [Lactiplantibacillus plantarum]ASI63370.1 hypothetical protein ALX04_006710 [Lactiplantibacillus plantarum subsp. plantarum]KAE9508249.1 hypothetical protein FET70_01713 [Lactiplantibacillus plantarum]ODO60110.1 hypothetical protein LPJSA22_00042 [Lactiplantibacillus plantarum]UOC07919.1 hypothetical protein LGQ11_10600 [Lactiplantibacillus plantarum]BBA82913.1 prophage P2b protein 10 [Lactiplantibacillus plantarum]